MSRIRSLALVLAVLALAACAQVDDPRGTVSPSPTPDPSATADPGTTPDERVTAAVADLAEREGLAQGDVAVVSLERVNWPNGAIGCPQPDRMYTQALVPGERLVLGAQGREFAYHAAKGGQFRYCASPGPHLPGDTDR